MPAPSNFATSTHLVSFGGCGRLTHVKIEYDGAAHDYVNTYQTTLGVQQFERNMKMQ